MYNWRERIAVVKGGIATATRVILAAKGTRLEAVATAALSKWLGVTARCFSVCLARAYMSKMTARLWETRLLQRLQWRARCKQAPRNGLVPALNQGFYSGDSVDIVLGVHDTRSLQSRSPRQ